MLEGDNGGMGLLLGLENRRKYSVRTWRAMGWDGCWNEAAIETSLGGWLACLADWLTGWWCLFVRVWHALRTGRLSSTWATITACD